MQYKPLQWSVRVSGCAYVEMWVMIKMEGKGREKVKKWEGGAGVKQRETSIFSVPPVVQGTCPVSDINKAKPSG